MRSRTRVSPGVTHARQGGQRQVPLVDKETLGSTQLEPGMIRENMSTIGLNVNGLLPGERVRVGNLLLEVATVCTPCDQPERIRPGLRRELYRRRVCRILTSGPYGRGDSIETAGWRGFREGSNAPLSAGC
jgi:MOSC domain-containing protein YiiM